MTAEDLLAFADGRLSEAQLLDAHWHLDQCEICQLLLSEAAHGLASATTVPQHTVEAGWNRTFRPGTLVGQRYLIRRFIARGGMGEVYEAFDRDLQERVALKTVTSTACDNPKAVQRLKAEVQLARRVSHPNVCRIYDFGTHMMPEAGAPISFLTMEFVEGETLGQRVRQNGALKMAEARKLGRQLLLGLSAAHDAGVLHRDFKSDNVMLRGEAGDQCSPVIMDFGLARALDQESHDSSSSNNSTLLGTFGYIAPEQLEAKPHSKASDVYAFGIVLFQMLTGELPFESSSSKAVAMFEVLKRGAPPPSSANPHIPKDLDDLVLGCLRRSPKDRYKTAGEVLAAFDATESRQGSSVDKRKLLLLPVALGLAVVALYIRFRATPRSSRPLASVASHSSATPAPRPSADPAIVAKGTTAGEVSPRPPPKTDSSAVKRAPFSTTPVEHSKGIPAHPVIASPAASNVPSAPESATPPRRHPPWEDPFPVSVPGEAPDPGLIPSIGR